jgi:hypothetical protein
MSNNTRPRLDVWTSTTQTSSLSYVIVLTNFTDSEANLGGFPFTGNWVNLMDNSSINVTTTGQTLSIEAGGFRVFGNQAALSNNDFELSEKEIELYPNPTTNSFAISSNVSKIEVYTITGQLIQTFSNVISNQELELNTIGTGIYLVKITENNGTSQTKKLIKK